MSTKTNLPPSATTGLSADAPFAGCGLRASLRKNSWTNSPLENYFNRGLAPAHGYRGVSSDDPGRASYRYGRDRSAPRRDSPGSRRRSLLLVTQRSDQRPGGAAAASQRNHQGSPARRRDRRLVSGQFPIRYRKPRRKTRCPLRRRSPLRRYSFGYEHITEERVDTMIARGRATQI